MSPNIYFPGVRTRGFSKLGVQLELKASTNIDYIEDFLIPYSHYQIPFLWIEIEKFPDVYEYPENIVRLVELVRQTNSTITIGIKTCPAFYAKYPNHPGSPPLAKYYNKFIQFIDSIVVNFNPEFIEFWNEPDADINAVPEWMGMYLGAWVENNNFFQGGYNYGKFVKYVYTRVKNLYPNTKFISGALMNVWEDQKFNSPFFMGMLESWKHFFSINPYSDYISYHYYRDWLWSKDYWDTIFKIADEIKKLINLPLIVSEFALANLSTDTYEFRVDQANYLDFLMSHSELNNLYRLQWYCLNYNLWMHTDMVVESNKQYVTTPVWDRFKYWVTGYE